MGSRRREVAGDLGAEAAKSRVQGAMQAVRRCLTRLRGRGRRDGAAGQHGKARGARWLRWWRAAATNPFGWVRERGPGEGMSTGESGRGRGERVASPGTSREKRQAGGGRGAWARTAATRLSSYWREVGDDWQRRWAGPARWAAYCAIQVSQVSLFLSFISCFLFFCNFVAFLKILRHFQKSPNCTCPLVRTYPTWNISLWDYLDI